MKPLSSWSNTSHSATSRSDRLHLHVLLLLLFALHFMTACHSSSQIPSYFEAYERIPIKTVLIQGQQIAYLDVGTGPPIILIHGFGGSMWQWEHQQQTLARHFRVLTLDLLGSGLSDKPDLDYLPDQMLNFFVGFMDTLQISKATLVGNSMGAGLAIGMALTHPARVEKLVLMDGLPQGIRDKLTSPTVRRALETHAPSWLITVGNWLFPTIGTESFLKEIVYDHTLLTPAVIDRSNRNRQHPGLIKPVMAVRQALPLWERDFATRLMTIRHPTLIIWGEHDRVFPQAVGEELHQMIADSQFLRVAHAGHLPQWEQPELVNQSLITYIQQ